MNATGSEPSPELSRASARSEHPNWVVVRANENDKPVVYLREMWQHRHKFRALVSRRVKARHDLSLSGMIWWLLEPITFAFVYFVLVEVLLDRGLPGIPWIVFVLPQLLAYKWLISSVTGAMASLPSSQGLLANYYFPRAYVPLADLVVGLFHFCIGLFTIPIVLLIYGMTPTWHLLWFPVIMVVQFLLLVGLSFPAAAIGLHLLELPRLTGSLIRLWFYLSPGIWTYTVDFRFQLEGWQVTLLKLNPLTGLFESYRGAVMNLTDNPDYAHLYPHAPGWELLWTLAVALVLIAAGGLWYIRRERLFGKVAI